MERLFPGLPVTNAIPLADHDYYDYLLSEVRRARWRVWASIFVVVVQRDDDPSGEVRSLLHALAEASAAGVSVRLLVGDSSTSAGIRYSNMVARSYATQLGLHVRHHRGADESSTHDKVVLIDNELVILGSHNWAALSFEQSYEDSIAICSEPMCTLKSLEFHHHWVEAAKRDGAKDQEPQPPSTPTTHGRPPRRKL